MNYYIELTVMDSPELTSYQIWSKLYTQLHLAFVEQQDDDGKIAYGVAFPQYRLKPEKQIGFLGFKVRIFAQTEQALQALNLAKWLERLTDYVHITSIRPVPVDKITGYAHYYRVIPRMSLDERIVHQAKRHHVATDVAREKLKDYQTEKNIEPFIQLKSQSTGHNFALYIGKNMAEQAQAGTFGSYGLSRTSTVPEFA